MSNLPTKLMGSALSSAAPVQPTRASTRVQRRTQRQLAELEGQQVVAEAAVTARAHLIGTATSAAMQTGAAIHHEGVLLAQMSPAAAQALEHLAAASTAGLARIILDASE